jgi:hypothetical protein
MTSEVVMTKFRSAGLCSALVLWMSVPALAHHSFAMFDREKQVTLVGTVREFQWTNPHSWIEMDVADSGGGIEKWSVEMNSPNNLQRQGWRSSTLKAGDKVTVIINPLRGGEKGGLFVSVTLPDGKVLDGKVLGDPTRRNPPAQAPQPATP